ncbi:MAG: deoxyribose-phosphate aldolase, partial [Acidimicrobiales bacterium]
MTSLSTAVLADVTATGASLRRFLCALPGVDAVGAEARVAALATRSIKGNTKLQALDLAISCVDLTTLEGADTPGKVASLCAKARLTDPGRASSG